MDQVEVGHRGVAHRLPRGLLRLLQRGPPGEGVDGQHLRRLEFVALATDVATKAALIT